ncbi:hypothetical protein IC582_000548 [Cucumis melo]
MYLGERGYSKGETDKTLFINKTNIDLIVAQINVDDIIFGGFPKTLVNNFINIMKSEFEMSLVDEQSCFLGLQTKQRSERMFISQEKYVKNLVKKFGLDQSQYKRTPVATHAKITKDTVGTAIDHKLYRSMIGSLLYLTASRPDIAYAVGTCAQYQSDPRTSHLNAVKRIIKYVHGTTDFGILYSYGTSSELVRYCDADWAGSADDRKSTSSGCFFLGNNLVSWLSKKQNCVSLSTAEAEFIAAGSGCTQMIWMKNMLNEYEIIQDVITLYCDNMSAIDISKNPVHHSRTKHIDIRHHFIRDLIENKVITLQHVRSNSQLADIFTKPLDATTFEHLRACLGVCKI